MIGHLLIQCTIIMVKLIYNQIRSYVELVLHVSHKREAIRKYKTIIHRENSNFDDRMIKLWNLFIRIFLKSAIQTPYCPPFSEFDMIILPLTSMHFLIGKKDVADSDLRMGVLSLAWQ